MEVGERIGGGTFGHVFYATNKAKGQEYALKIETENTQDSRIFGEYRILKYFSGALGIPKVYFESNYGNQNAFTMELLGDSLEVLFQKCGRKFSLKTVLMLADQMLSRIQYVHEKGIIHRDIKPDNFAIGLNENSSILYLIDFGISRRYIDPKTMQHIPYREGRKFVGTSRYGSINVHIGIESSRRDDMESIAYTLIYLLKGYLPWQNLKNDPCRLVYKSQFDEVMQQKLSTSIDSLCEGLPIEFAVFLTDIRKLSFEQRPNYEQYRQIFRSLFINCGFVYDSVYDWDQIKAEPEYQPSKLPPICSKAVKAFVPDESENQVPNPRLGLPTQQSKSTMMLQNTLVGRRLSLKHNLTFHRLGHPKIPQ